MLIVENTEHFRIEKPCILTIGTFDGVHLGHQKLLKRLQELSQIHQLQTVILTFAPHPRKVLFPEQSDLKLITTTSEKLKLLEDYGIDITVVYPFTMVFSEISAQQYIQDLLISKLKVKYLVIGYDHKFGKNRSGDIQTLLSFAPLHGFEVEEISAKDIDSIAVSSSKIRQALEKGDIDTVNTYLGYTYSFSGKVVKGKQLGRTIGYPTANIEIVSAEKMLPKEGVYFVKVSLNEGDFFGMLNIGKNPTTDSDNLLKTEVHLFHFNSDIYNKDIRVSVLAYLRAEKKFSDLTVLKEQLLKDKELCLTLLQQHAH